MAQIFVSARLTFSLALVAQIFASAWLKYSLTFTPQLILDMRLLVCLLQMILQEAAMGILNTYQRYIDAAIKNLYHFLMIRRW